MINLKILNEIANNKRIRYLLTDCGIGFVVSMILYDIHSKRLDNEYKEKERIK